MKIKLTFLFSAMLSASFMAQGQNFVADPSFESSAVGGTVTGWVEGGDADAQKIEFSANWTPDGQRHLTHWLANAYIADTYQTITLPNGTYQLSALVVGDSKFNQRKLYAKDFGGAEVSVPVPAYAAWTTVTTPVITVTTGQVTIGFYHDGQANSWMSADKVELVPASVQPVSLVSFNLNSNTSGVSLSWKTASETNNSHFTIQRSTDGATFATIGTIKGGKNTNSLSSYSFTDPNPVSGATNYYRLTQVDLDGKQTQLGDRSIKVAALARYSVYPNPASDELTISLAGEENGSCNVKITDYSGRVLVSSDRKLEGGLMKLSISEIPSGIYLLSVTSATVNQTSSILIRK